MGLKKIAKKVKKTAKKAVKVAAPIASVIPGPWQVPALAYQSANAAIHGDALGAIANGLGAYGAGGGFSSGGFNSNTLTNPGGLSDWYSNAYGPEAGWAGGTPVNSGYNSPIEFGPELGYDTSIFGDAPPNLGNMSNSGTNPASPFVGGDFSPLTDSIPSIETIKDYPITPVDITGSTGGAAANTLSSTVPANGTNTLTNGSSGITRAINTTSGVTGLINGVAGVASGVVDLVAAGNTADLQKTIKQRSDPFGSQRAFYQGQLKDSYTNPFGSAENQGLLNMYQQAAARKAAANGQRSNPLHQNIAFSNAMLPQLNEQRKTLGNLAGADIDPNGGNAAMTALNGTGASQTANGYASAAQGLQSLYNYFNQG